MFDTFTGPITDFQREGSARTQPDVLTIPANRWQTALVEFVRASPLADCTTGRLDELGAVQVIADRPVVTLSTGERHCWALLVDLVAGDLRDLLTHADPRTLTALGSLTAQLREAASA